MQNQELLQNYREQIDSLDKELLYLFSRRFIMVSEIGNIKKLENMQVLQISRWEELLKENIRVWLEMGLEKDFIVDIWERIHKESLEIEK